MMEKLMIWIENQFFYIKSTKTDLRNLRVTSGKGTILFEEDKMNAWKIAATDIATLLVPSKESRAFIHYGEEANELSTDSFDINILTPLQITTEQQQLYLYFSLDQKLRFMWHQLPSARAYHLSNHTEIIEGDNPALKVTVETKNIPLNQITLYIKERESKEYTTISLPVSESIKVGVNTFASTCLFSFNKELLSDNVFANLSPSHYQLTILDYFVTIDSHFVPLTGYQFRLKAPSKEHAEGHFSDTQKKMIFLRFYSTGYGNLSSRATALSYQTGLTYLSLFDQTTSLSKPDKPILLIFEYPHKAQENGLIFFRYLMMEDQTFDTYYVIEEDSPDLKNLAPFESRVIKYKSPEHIHLFFQASYLISSHTPNYGIPLLTQVAEERRTQMHKIFLQHGITALKNVERLYGRKSQPHLIDTFLVSSERESQLVQKEMYYPVEAVKVTGLPRFDTLLQGSNLWRSYQTRKKVLIMPSWRKDQEHLSDAEFLQTEYYLNFKKLLAHARLQALIHEKGVLVSFYLHNNFQKYRHLFHNESIKILDAKKENVQNLLKTHGILITDYSSVGLDFSLQKRSVIYYQFDEIVPEIWVSDQQPFLLPGPICPTAEEVICEIEKKIKWNILDKKYRKTLKTSIYSQLDTNACQRIYTELKKIEANKTTLES